MNGNTICVKKPKKNKRTMKLSKEASRLFAEYLRAEEACEEPNYLQPNKLDDTFGAIRRISAAADEIFGQVVGKILAER